VLFRSGISLEHFLTVGLLLFALGLYTVLTRRNAIGILMGVELVLNSVKVNFVAFDRYRPGGGFDGQIAALFVIVLAAAEAAVAVAICMNVYKNLNTIDVDRGDALHG